MQEMESPLKIAMDIRPALSRGTGVGTFVEQLARALDSLPGDHQLRLFSSSLKQRWPLNKLSGLNKSTLIDKKIPVQLMNLLWHRLSWPPVDHFAGKVDISHSPTPLIMPSRGKKVVTLHDLYFLKRPEHTVNEIRRDYPALVKKHAALADGILAVSQATADDAVELLGVDKEKIIVGWNDAAPLYDEKPTRRELETIRDLVQDPFFLFVGTIEPRKNLSALLEAFSIVSKKCANLKLVVAGAYGWKFEQFKATLDKIHNHEKVWISGYRDNRFIRALYHSAEALVMPSFCEGFGLPLVEAMACGCPLIVADNSSLPEVAGEAALFWKSGKVDELAWLMETVIQDSQTRERLRNSGYQRRKAFSWNKTALKVMGLYNSLVR